MRSLLLYVLSIVYLQSGQYDKVKITSELSSIYVYHKGKAVKVHRIQDTAHKITGEYAKQYRPNKDIQPIRIHKNIQTIGEVELLQFMQDKGNSGKGTLIDIRSKKDYSKESIPSAVNIPAEVKNNKNKMKKILTLFGVYNIDNELDTSHAIDLAVYCHGLWCKKSVEFIQVLLDMGYPEDKIYYYRGGFQMWKILGFTTVTNEKR